MDRPSNQDAVRGTRYAEVHTSARTSQGTALRVHGMVGQRRRLAPGCLGPPSGSINAMAKPLRGGTPVEPIATAASVGTVLVLVFHRERGVGGVCGEKPDRVSLPVQVEWGAKNEERRSSSTKRSMDQTLKGGGDASHAGPGAGGRLEKKSM